MGRHGTATIGAGFLLCLALLVPVAAGAQGEPDATEASDDFEALVREGQEAYTAERWRAAAEAFEGAYEIKSEPNLLYNIGRAYESAGQFETAISYFERFVNQPGIEIESRRDALDRIETLREVVDLRDRGEEVAREEVESETSDRGLADPAEPAPTSQPASTNNYLPAAILLGVGGSSLVAGTVFAFLTAGQHTEFQAADTLVARRRAAEKGGTYSVVADGLLISGAAVAAAGLGFVIWPPKTQTSRARGPTLAPTIGRGAAGVTIGLDF